VHRRARGRGLRDLVLTGREDLQRSDPLWPGQLATLAAIGLYVLLPDQLTIGPGWPLPAAEAAVLAVLVATAPGAGARRRREAAIGLVLVAALANLVALGFLVHYLVAGGRAKGADLILGGVLIWSTNLLLFTVLYWELDRGGPRRPGADLAPIAPDLLFVQMSDGRPYSVPGWMPGFGDYLYVSLTNQTAFSPTDTMPLTLRVKALMGVQGVAALVTTGVVVARAVNLLG
jgi:hypothetical protein